MPDLPQQNVGGEADQHRQVMLHLETARLNVEHAQYLARRGLTLDASARDLLTRIADCATVMLRQNGADDV